MAFFTKERIDLIKQQAQTVKSNYNEAKEKVYSAKQEYDNIKQYNQEKKTRFECTSLQGIGVIPKGSKVTLLLNPDTEYLTIKYDKDICITLPYARILGFRVEHVTEEIEDKTASLTGSVLSSGLLGRGVVGKAGRIAGDVMMALRKTKAIWIGVLIYKDKNGTTKELSFITYEQELERNEKPAKRREDDVFERTINLIAMRNNSEMMEL